MKHPAHHFFTSFLSPSKNTRIFLARNSPITRQQLFNYLPPRIALTSDEIERSEQFATQQLREHWEFSRTLLRLLLARELKTTPQKATIKLSPLGKPLNPHLSLSLSHTPRLTAIALGPATLSLGVDIQPVCSEATACSIQSFFHPQEQEEIKRGQIADFTENCTQIWARKEAFLKALGTGLLREPHLDYLGSPHKAQTPPNHTGNLYDITHEKLENHKMSLCELYPHTTPSSLH